MTAPIVDSRTTLAESDNSAISFASILAGAVAIAATALVLALVGTGMGLEIATPWSGLAVATKKFAASTAIALIVIEWLSSAVGGYVTGRMRVRWVNVHKDEIFFRDTAHGFLAWAVATLLAAMLTASAFASALSGGAHALAVASSAGQGPSHVASEAISSVTNEVSYLTDELLRAPQSQSSTAGASDLRSEFSRILLRGLAGEIPQADKDYIAELVGARVGVDAAETRKRVDNVLRQIEEAKRSAAELANSARKVVATTSLMAALALAIGAFIASAAAGLGGRRRDE
jgi:hypothetical protein